jgi:uncharacterized protein
MITRWTGISASQLPAFVENGIYKMPNLVFASNALFAVFAFLLPALVYAYLADPQPIKYLGGRAPGKGIQTFWVMLLALSLIFFISPLAEWLKQIDLGSASRELDEQRSKFLFAYMASGNAWTVVKSLFLIALLPALCEEVFFRGLLMKFGYSIFKKWWLAITVSALVFAAFHTSISEFVPIFIAGVILGTVYYLTSSLWMNILLHLVFNGLQLLLGIYTNPELEHSMTQTSTLIIIFCVAGLITAIGLYMLNRARTPLPNKWSIVLQPEPEEEWDMDKENEK